MQEQDEDYIPFNQDTPQDTSQTTYSAPTHAAEYVSYQNQKSSPASSLASGGSQANLYAGQPNVKLIDERDAAGGVTEDWDLDQDDLADIEKRVKYTRNVNEKFTKLYVGTTSGDSVATSKEEASQVLVDHLQCWLQLHNFTKMSAEKLTSQLRKCIRVNGTISGYIQKNTKDVLVQPEKEEKEIRRKERRRRKKRGSKRIVDEVEEKSEEEKEGNPQNEFVIRVKYYITCRDAPEKTLLWYLYSCLSLCKPDWELLVDKKVTIDYKIDLIRLRGKEEFKIKSNFLNDMEDATPHDHHHHDKNEKPGFFDRLVGLIPGDKKKEKTPPQWK
jgi:hypothetical protein